MLRGRGSWSYVGHSIYGYAGTCAADGDLHGSRPSSVVERRAEGCDRCREREWSRVGERGGAAPWTDAGTTVRLAAPGVCGFGGAERTGELRVGRGRPVADR